MNWDRPPVVELEDIDQQDASPDDLMDRLIDPWCGARYVIFRGKRYLMTDGQRRRLAGMRGTARVSIW